MNKSGTIRLALSTIVVLSSVVSYVLLADVYTLPSVSEAQLPPSYNDHRVTVANNAHGLTWSGLGEPPCIAVTRRIAHSNDLSLNGSGRIGITGPDGASSVSSSHSQEDDREDSEWWWETTVTNAGANSTGDMKMHVEDDEVLHQHVDLRLYDVLKFATTSTTQALLTVRGSQSLKFSMLYRDLDKMDNEDEDKFARCKFTAIVKHYTGRTLKQFFNFTRSQPLQATDMIEVSAEVEISPGASTPASVTFAAAAGTTRVVAMQATYNEVIPENPHASYRQYQIDCDSFGLLFNYTALWAEINIDDNAWWNGDQGSEFYVTWQIINQFTSIVVECQPCGVNNGPLQNQDDPVDPTEGGGGE